jgi:hypothetical protein
MTMLKEVWLFSQHSVFIYNSIDMLGTVVFTTRPVVELFMDLPDPVLSGYTEDKLVHLIVGRSIKTTISSF